MSPWRHDPLYLKISQLYVGPVCRDREAEFCHSKEKVLKQVLYYNIHMVSFQSASATAACLYTQCWPRRPQGRVKAVFQKWMYFTFVLPTF